MSEYFWTLVQAGFSVIFIPSRYYVRLILQKDNLQCERKIDVLALGQAKDRDAYVEQVARHMERKFTQGEPSGL